MNRAYDKLLSCYKSVQEKIDFQPEVAMVLGSGLGDYADTIDIRKTLDYKDIDGFPTSTVKGHKGRFVFGYINQVPVVIMQGRVHYYEGYDMSDVVLPIRLMKLMGAKILFLTNAAGGVNFDYNPGDFMLIVDHISSFVPSPLIGENFDELGERFPDMRDVYDEELKDIIRDTAMNLKMRIKEGVYMQFTGPNYETPNEIKMARVLGADAVGMSTACEAMVANHMGMKVCGISCITNMGSGMTPNPLSHAEVQETADKVAINFKKLLTETVNSIGREFDL